MKKIKNINGEGKRGYFLENAKFLIIEQINSFLSGNTKILWPNYQTAKGSSILHFQENHIIQN